MKQSFRYVGERESKKKQNVQECVEFILGKDYGTTIADNELARILGYSIADEEGYHQYRTIMQKVKKILLQYGYILKSISRVGYYILKPTEASKHCYRTYVKRTGKLLDKSDYVLEHIDRTNMADIRIEEINNMVALNKQLIHNVAQTISESAYYSRKEYYDSLED